MSEETEKQAPKKGSRRRVAVIAAVVIALAGGTALVVRWQLEVRRAREAAAARAAAVQAACGAQGPEVLGFAADKGGLPLPGDKRVVKVEQQGYVMDPDGSMMLPQTLTAPQPIYRVVMKAQCAEKPYAWKLLTLDRDLGEMTALWVSARSGNTPSPDGTWSAPTPNFKEASNELSPRLTGKYVELNFTLLAAERPNGPKLKGFRLCYACGKDAL